MAFTSLLISSWEEMANGNRAGPSGPIIVIPFGATEGTRCAHFGSLDAMGEKHFAHLLMHARYKALLHIVEAGQFFTLANPTYFEMLQT